MHTITLNLAGEIVQVRYSDDFSTLQVKRPAGDFSNFQPMRLSCGMVVDRPTMVKVLKRKLGHDEIN